MLIGHATSEINPSDGILMGGYPTPEPRRASGVHDDLRITAISCRESASDKHTVLVAFDGIAVPPGLGEVMAAAFGPDVQVVAVASHTHSAPALKIWDQGIIGEYSPSYMDGLIEQLVASVSMALSSESPGEIHIGTARVREPVAANRRQTSGKSEGTVRVIEVRDQDQTARSLFVIYGCHPTVLGADNSAVSADLVWGIRQWVGQPALGYLPGGAGNQSTRSTRRDSTFEECLRLGEVIGRAVNEARQNLAPCTASKLAVATIRINPRRFPDFAESKKRVDRWSAERDRLVRAGASADEKRTAEVQLIGANHDLRRARSGFFYTEMEVEIARWELGTISIAFWPVEPGYELAEKLETEGTWLSGYANDYFGYLLEPEDYDRGGYEVAASPFGRDAAEVFTRKTLQMAGSQR